MSFDSRQLTWVWGGSSQHRRTPPHPLQKQSTRSSSLAARNDETLNRIGTKTTVSSPMFRDENLKARVAAPGVPPAASRPNPNSESRNPKEGRIPKAEATLGHFGFRVSAFFRPSDFGLRVWAFALTGWWYCPGRPCSPALEVFDGSALRQWAHSGTINSSHHETGIRHRHPA